MLPHQISLAEAIELTSRFRNNPGPDMPLSETFGKNSVDALLAQPGCVSFRIYLGRKEDNSICSVLVAADAEGNDILPSSVARTSQSDEDDDDEIILENAFHCPPACPPHSLLNG
jgi:hypothetical protein